MMDIRILIVDDHTLFRRGLCALLARNPRMQVIGDAGDAGEGIRRATELQPDVILLDNHLPGVSGIAAIGSLQAAAPAARIVMLTVSEDGQDLAAALQAGASGYLLKTIEGEELAAALERAMRGESVVAPGMMGKLVSAYRQATSSPPESAKDIAPPTLRDQLSHREQDILRGIVRGESNKEIARALGIAETTVKIHVQHILRKLDVSSRVHAAVIATSQGLV
jgi:two-component system nitrate/nitrite response regulator NarL